MPPASPTQLRLPLQGEPALGADDFLVDLFNAETVRRVRGWRTWPGAALTLVGPEGVGKSHLAAVWAAEAEAERVGAGDPLPTLAPGRSVLVEDADRAGDIGETLFHLINRAAHGEGALLVTGRTLPASWPAGLPDLRSRLNALPVAELGAPDEALLRRLLVKAFRERSVKPGAGLLDYLVLRIERSAPAARAIVDRLEALASDHRVGLALAREALGDPARDGAEGEDD